MDRLKEIEARLSAISNEMDQDGADIKALNAEVDKLQEEQRSIKADIETRQQMRKKIASGMVPAVVIEENKEEKTMEKTFSVDSAEYREAYLKNLQGKTLDAEERAAVNANAAIPTQTMNKIIARFEDSPVLSRIDMTHFAGGLTIPVEGTVNAASWVAMATAATDSADTLESITLGAYKLIKTVEITADVSAMAIPAFEDWLVARLANKIEVAVDAAVIAGTGSNQATGIMTTVSASGKTFTKAKATYVDLLNIIAALGTAYSRNAVFIMPRKLFYTDVLGIVDNGGEPVIHQDVESPAKYNILGYPVILDDNVTADHILFGDLYAYKFNFAQDPVVTSDTSVAFRTGSTVYRAMALADGKLAEAGAFVHFARAAS